MIGTERKRFCGECQLNVYNLSGMSRAEAENLLLDSEGRLCVKFYKRADGKVLTKDCPVGWRAIQRRVSRTATAFASVAFAALGGIGLTNYFAKASEQQVMGAIMPNIENSTINSGIDFEEINSNVAVQEKPTATMGKIMVIGRIVPSYETKGKASDFNQVKGRVLSEVDR